MDNRLTAERIERQVIRLCHAGLDATNFRIQVMRSLCKLIPVDAFFFATADPATLLYTGAVREGIAPSATPLFVANEFLQEDVNKFASLARSPFPVAALSQATRDDLAASARYREILEPLGLGDELRAALRTGSTCWGYVCLHRERSAQPFSAAEAACLARLAPHLAEGLRIALLTGTESRHESPDEPGLLLLTDDLAVVATTPAAERWLAEVSAEEWPKNSELPRLVRAVAAQLRAIEKGIAPADALPIARLRTRSGRWLVIHASRLSGRESAGRVAIILEPARPAEIAPLILQVYRLTERETQLVQLVLQGRSTAEIGESLVVSQLTVQQHLKAVFDKVGVASRRELVARVFAENYKAGFLKRSLADNSSISPL